VIKPAINATAGTNFVAFMWVRLAQWGPPGLASLQWPRTRALAGSADFAIAA